MSIERTIFTYRLVIERDRSKPLFDLVGTDNFCDCYKHVWQSSLSDRWQYVFAHARRCIDLIVDRLLIINGGGVLEDPEQHKLIKEHLLELIDHIQGMMLPNGGIRPVSDQDVNRQTMGIRVVLQQDFMVFDDGSCTE